MFPQQSFLFSQALGAAKSITNRKRGKISGQLQAREYQSPVVSATKSITNRKRGKQSVIIRLRSDSTLQITIIDINRIFAYLLDRRGKNASRIP